MRNLLRLSLPILTIFLIISTVSKADVDEERWNNISNQVSEDLITCASFFMVSAKGVENRGKPQDKEISDKWLLQSARIFSFSETISRAIGQKPEVPGIRLKMITESMMEEMGGHYMNYSIISSKYLDKCVKLASDPSGALASRMKVPN